MPNSAPRISVATSVAVMPLSAARSRMAATSSVGSRKVRRVLSPFDGRPRFFCSMAGSSSFVSDEMVGGAPIRMGDACQRFRSTWRMKVTASLLARDRRRNAVSAEPKRATIAGSVRCREPSVSSRTRRSVLENKTVVEEFEAAHRRHGRVGRLDEQLNGGQLGKDLKMPKLLALDAEVPVGVAECGRAKGDHDVVARLIEDRLAVEACLDDAVAELVPRIGPGQLEPGPGAGY